ncbi:tumor necrosis factor alpha-induced protein 8-like protein 3 isoform X2 [Tympanuchus pallidicinctus]|uniref:tumor necrosis factor alpha-induced protein 8-like protein 3 isoform X2 n=1 Tax=Tympanuchus pallidicinctus TaxID=109042 RepID=UPI0022874B67|nr:tumor necrosis factor alpha-induced protein 8-like protein 3 isoform X2 [Tympanuchus pallidicinctus]
MAKTKQGLLWGRSSEGKVVTESRGMPTRTKRGKKGAERCQFGPILSPAPQLRGRPQLSGSPRPSSLKPIRTAPNSRNAEADRCLLPPPPLPGARPSLRPGSQWHGARCCLRRPGGEQRRRRRQALLFACSPAPGAPEPRPRFPAPPIPAAWTRTPGSLAKASWSHLQVHLQV